MAIVMHETRCCHDGIEHPVDELVRWWSRKLVTGEWHQDGDRKLVVDTG